MKIPQQSHYGRITLLSSAIVFEQTLNVFLFSGIENEAKAKGYSRLGASRREGSIQGHWHGFAVRSFTTATGAAFSGDFRQIAAEVAQRNPIGKGGGDSLPKSVLGKRGCGSCRLGPGVLLARVQTRSRNLPDQVQTE